MNNARLYFDDENVSDFEDFKLIHKDVLTVTQFNGSEPAVATDVKYEKTGEVEDGYVVYRRKIDE